MRKFLFCGLLLALGWSWAQVPFTIVRPQNGAQVRERVEFRLPSRSVPPGAFIAVSIDNQFVEAVAPTALISDHQKGHLVYVWDTKAKNVPDGDHKIEFALYAAEGEEQPPRLLDRSSVTVQVANKVRNVPKEGVRLAYRWQTGKALVYRTNFLFKNVTEVKQSGLPPTEEVLLDFTHRLLLSVMDWRAGEALVSWIITPPVRWLYRGQWYAYPEQAFAPVYQEMDSTGRVPYQATPTVVGEMRIVSVGSLPVLPATPVKEGSRWRTEVVLYDPTETGTNLEAKIAARFPCSAKLESFEWEKGYKCAKIVYELATGNLPTRIEFADYTLEKPKLKLKRVVYFAYDIGQMVRSDLSIEVEAAVQEQAGGFGAGGGRMGGGGYAPSQFGGRGYGGGEDEGEGMMGGGRLRGRRGGGQPLGGQPGFPPGAPPGGDRGGRGAATQPGQETLVRTIISNQYELLRIQ